jgi:hypothetical protein
MGKIILLCIILLIPLIALAEDEQPIILARADSIMMMLVGMGPQSTPASGPSGDGILLEDDSGFFLILEDVGTNYLLLE